jgi:hypothetical protein
MVIKATRSPLLDKLNKINTDIKWIIPVATIKRRCITWVNTYINSDFNIDMGNELDTLQNSNRLFQNVSVGICLNI